MLKSKTAVNSGAAGQIAAFTASLAGGFFLAGTQIAGNPSFANISLAGALPLPLSAAVLTGSLLRYMIASNVAASMVQLTAMMICVIHKMFFEHATDAKSCGICATAAVFLSGAAVSAIIGEFLYKLLFYVFYGALAGAATYCMALLVSNLRNRLVLDLSTPISCAYAVVYTIVLSALCSVSLPYVNIGIILGTAVTITAAYRYGYTGGVLCGALTTCGAFLASTSCGMSVVLLPAAGLLTGYLNKQKPMLTAGFFVGVSFLFMVFTRVTADSIFRLVNIICGSLIFLALCPYFSDKWIFTGRESSALSEIISTRMGFLANSIETVRYESGRISEVLTKNSEMNDEVEVNSAEVCTHCHRRLACWYNNYDSTKRAFRKLSEMYEFSRENFPFELSDCLHKSELICAFEKSAREKATARLLSMRFSESQRLLSEQIKITEEIISAASERIDVRYSESISLSIREKLLKYGYQAKNVIAYYNSQNRLLIELYFDFTDAPKSCVRVCDLIADELKLNLDYFEP